MSTQELSIEHPEQTAGSQRVIEAEIRLPRFEDLQLPDLNLEPAKAVAGQILVTSLGIGVLLVRAVQAGVKAANRAGMDTVEHPGPVTDAIRALVRPRPHESTTGQGKRGQFAVPILPLEDYGNLSEDQVLQKLDDLAVDQLCTLQSFERDHQARARVLAALDQRLMAH